MHRASENKRLLGRQEIFFPSRGSSNILQITPSYETGIIAAQVDYMYFSLSFCIIHKITLKFLVSFQDNNNIIKFLTYNLKLLFLLSKFNELLMGVKHVWGTNLYSVHKNTICMKTVMYSSE